MEGDPAPLPLLSEGTISDPVSGGLLACNPVVDLVATVSNDGVLNVWRPGGQLVSTHVERNQRISALSWNAEGQPLAFGYANGTAKLVFLENNKTAHNIGLPNPDGAGVTHIAWSRNRIGKRSSVTSSRPAGYWDKLLSREPETDGKQEVLDLPLELTFLEIDTALPKLGPLPVSGGSGDDMFVFSTRSSLDYVFRQMREDLEPDRVNVMILGRTDGTIQISIHESFVIGTFYPGRSDSATASEGLEFCCHASDPDIPTYSLLLRPRGGGRGALYLIPMDLTFLHSSPINLSLLSSKVTDFQVLLRYISQTQAHMIGEWKSTRELPDRFLLGIQEDLEKMPHGPVSIVQALYHTVVTGHVFPPVREWLVDRVAERGHKRWDKAVVSGLENLRNLVHENMIPALERTAIILSRLLGLARFHSTNDSLGFNAAQVTKLIDIVSCLTLISHKILVSTMEELELFTTFSSWLRFEIDNLASSSTSEEISEKEATLDSAKVLTYIQRYLTSSPLALYLGDVSQDDYKNDWEHVEDGLSLLDMLDKQLQRHDTRRPAMRALPQLDFLFMYLNRHSNAVFASIAESHKRGVRLGRETKLEIGSNISKYDVRMFAKQAPDRIDGVTFTAVGSEKAQDEVYIFRTTIEMINGISSGISTAATSLSLAGGRILDFKFLNDSSLLVLWSAQDSPPTLLNVPFQLLTYSEYANQGVPEPLRIDERDVIRTFSSTTFGELSGFMPIQMQVMPASNMKGDVPARIYLLGRDKFTYKAFTLPDKWEPRVLPGAQEDTAMG